MEIEVTDFFPATTDYMGSIFSAIEQTEIAVYHSRSEFMMNTTISQAGLAQLIRKLKEI